ncbi:tyrosine-type recombinase/integrase [Gracilibacillus suaedae]|uniref:tyrosine-type recombinase/integrase n=1 Tax=Gracilibacillus suaedae TaxID=2820273 RepID=UPI001ABE8EF8|nr:tyrosine-type recombinase/integrase [Gracilibacillus suaedae]
MKNPNGYGSVFKLSGKRRRPFAVRITVGWDDEGKQQYDYLGYYASRKEAMVALAEYNENPYALESTKITFASMYQMFYKEKFKNIPNHKEKSSKNGYSAAYNHSKDLHEMRFIDIKTSHLQDLIDKCEKGHGTKRKIKVLFNQMYKFAMKNDMVSKDYSKYIVMPKNESGSNRSPFTQHEINLLWDNIGHIEDVDTALIMIYSGLRPGELIEIKNKDIHLKERHFRGGIKTAAGKNRIIPIHKKIHTLIEKRMDPENEYLIVNQDNKHLSYYTYYHNRWKKMMEQLGLNHKPHDCRHTFATLMNNAEANKVAIQRIMGHASKDITDKVYTHKDIEQLLIAIDML